MPQMKTVSYSSPAAMNRDVQAHAAHGWTVVSTSTFQPRSGVGRTVALGFLGAAVFKPKPQLVVTYGLFDAPIKADSEQRQQQHTEAQRAAAQRQVEQSTALTWIKVSGFLGRPSRIQVIGPEYELTRETCEQFFTTYGRRPSRSYARRVQRWAQQAFAEHEALAAQRVEQQPDDQFEDS